MLSVQMYNGLEVLMLSPEVERSSPRFVYQESR
jgi:hypothetical protein